MERSFCWLVLSLSLALAACGAHVLEQQESIFERAEPVPSLLAEAIALDSQYGMSTLAGDAGSVRMFTLTSEDVLGEPFSHIIFLAPTEHADVWSFAASLTGHEWGDAPADSEWRTIITGASTIRDVLVGDLPGLHLLLNLRDTLAAANVDFSDTAIVGATASVFLLRVGDQYWDVNQQLLLTQDEIDGIVTRYDEVVDHNSQPGVLDDVEAKWAELYAYEALVQQETGYSLQSLSTPDGRLDVAAALAFAAATDGGLGSAAYTDHGRRCAFLGLFCSHRLEGNIPAAQQATHGGLRQSRADYFGSGSTPVAFNSITCVTNNPVHGVALLGCGPSAFIGLLGERYVNHNVAVAGRCMTPATNPSCHTQMSYNAFRQWMVAENGVNGRPRIANYMGTCAVGTGNNREGLTLLSGFTNGIQNFLSETNTNLTLRWRAGIGGSTGWNQSAAADIIHRQVGMAENPVLAAYWPTATTAHYAPIVRYDILWSAGVSITIRTLDGGNQWYVLGGTWSGQEGVFYLE